MPTTPVLGGNPPLIPPTIADAARLVAVEMTGVIGGFDKDDTGKEAPGNDLIIGFWASASGSDCFLLSYPWAKVQLSPYLQVPSKF